jgi:hypothetical protein
MAYRMPKPVKNAPNAMNKRSPPKNPYDANLNLILADRFDRSKASSEPQERSSRLSN